MKKSQFKLAKVIKLKKVEEFKECKRLSIVFIKKQWIDARMKSLDEEIQSTQQALRHIKDLSEYFVLKNYLSDLEEAVIGLSKEQERLKKEYVLSQKSVEAKRNHRKIIENISRRYYAGWQKQQRKIDG